MHGPVIDLFDCAESLHTAVEVTAGNQLFNVVVDTDATASQIVRHLIRDRVGRVTCLPLNRLNVIKDMPLRLRCCCKRCFVFVCGGRGVFYAASVPAHQAAGKS